MEYSIKDSFSFDRMKSLMVKNLVENKKALLIQLGVIAGVIAIGTWFITQMVIDDYDPSSWEEYFRQPDMDPALFPLSVFFCLCIMTFLCYGASLIMFPMKDKEGRLEMLMRPGTPAEKYLVRWIIFVPVNLVAIILSCIVIDLARCGILMVSCDKEAIIRPVISVFRFVGKMDGILDFISTCFVIQAFFGLGSSFMPKRSFGKTFLAGLVFWFLSALITFFIFLSLPELRYGQIWHEGPDGINYLSIFKTIMGVCMWYLAYLRFKEDEIVPRIRTNKGLKPSTKYTIALLVIGYLWFFALMYI